MESLSHFSFQGILEGCGGGNGENAGGGSKERLAQHLTLGVPSQHVSTCLAAKLDWNSYPMPLGKEVSTCPERERNAIAVFYFMLRKALGAHREFKYNCPSKGCSSLGPMP